MTITTNIHGNPDLAFITDFMGGRAMIRVLCDVPEPVPEQAEEGDKDRDKAAKANSLKSRQRTFTEAATWLEAFATDPSVEAIRTSDLAVSIIASQAMLTMRAQSKNEHQWLRAFDGRRVVVEVDGKKIRFTAGEAIKDALAPYDYTMMDASALASELKSRGVRLVINGDSVFEPGQTSPIQKYRLIELLRQSDEARALAGRNLRLA